MPRPRKCRRVCAKPHCTEFGPAGDSGNQTIEMTIDEFEAIRLIDFEGLTQEQCAETMEVARTTVQAIYAVARKKLAQCVVQGNKLFITGGDVVYCERKNHGCNKACRRCNKLQNMLSDEDKKSVD